MLRGILGTGGSAPVGGSGTAGTIPVWSTGTTLGNSPLTVSGSNVGLGVPVPLAQLHISRAGGASNAEYIRLQNTTAATGSAVGINFWQNNAITAVGRIEGTVTAGGSYDTAFSNWNGSALAEGMRLTGSGRLLIGTATAPSSGSVLTVCFKTSGAAGSEWHNSSGGNGGLALVPTATGGASLYPYTGAVGSEAYGSPITLSTTGVDISTAGFGLKLPSAPGNADTQTFDAYNEVTLSSGFTTSGITSTGTVVVTARATRYARGIALAVKIAPSGGAALTFASGWYVTLTGIPQMPDTGALAAATSDGVGRSGIFIDAAATPTIYGGTSGAYGTLGTNITANVCGLIT